MEKHASISANQGLVLDSRTAGHLVSSIIMVFMLLSVSQVAAATVSCYQSITQNTVMDNDLVCSTGDALKITANNVVLDCNGHSITFNGTGGDTGNAGVYVRYNYRNITIKNCNIIITSNSGDGIVLRNGINGSSVINCTATGVSPYGGSIYVASGGYNNSIINCTARSIGVNPGVGTRIISSKAEYIYISVGSLDTQVIDTIAELPGTSSRMAAIWLFQANNTLMINTTGIIKDRNSSQCCAGGIVLEYAKNSTLINCTGATQNVTSNDRGGFFLRSNSVGNTLINCTAIRGGSETAMYIEGGSSNNTLTGLFVNGSGGTALYFYQSNYNNLTNLAVIGKYGYIISNSQGNNIVNNTINTTSTGISIGASVNNRIINSSIGSDTGTGIQISSANSNSIIGSKINSNGSHAYGISLSSAINNTISNSRVISATGNSYGIYSWKSANNQIINSNISGGNVGVSLQSSPDNRLINSTFQANLNYGAHLSYTNNTQIVNCSFSTLGDGGWGISFESTSSNNTVTGSFIRTKDTRGYTQYTINFENNANNNKIINSIVNTEGSSYCDPYDRKFVFTSSSNNEIRNATVGPDNKCHHIVLQGKSPGNTFIDTTIPSTANLYASPPYATQTNDSIAIKWSMDLAIQAIGGTPDNALVTIYDKSGAQVYSGYTDATGKIPTQTVTEYVWNSSGKMYQTPHTIVAYKAPVTATLNVTVNSSKNVTMILLFDAAPPVTTASVSGTVGQNGWYTSDVAVALAATDDSSGVNATKYSFDGVSWSQYSSPLVLSAEGSSTVYYYSIDNAGNTEDINSLNVKIDKTAPSAPVLNDPGEWDIDGNVAVSWSASSDATSGMDKYRVYRCNVITVGQTCTEAYLADAQGISYSDTGLFDANQYYYTVSAMDMAGLESQMSNEVDIKIDKTPPLPPEMSITNAIGAYVNQLGVSLAWTASQDPGAIASGVDYYNIFKGLASGAETLLTTVQETVLQHQDLSVAEGTKYYYQVNAVDNAGNTGDKSNELFVTPDVTAPTSSAALSGVMGDAGWYVSDVTIAITATDALSGVQRKEYDIDAGWTEYTGPVTVSAEGMTTANYRSVDNVNNAETAKSAVVKLDKTAPSSSASSSCTMGQNGWCVGDATVTLSSSDSISGVSKIEYSTNGGMSWSTYSSPFAVSSDGISLVLYKGTDAAGNVEVQKELVVKVDKTAPTTSHTASPDSDADGAYGSVATVTLSASDSASGAVATFYSVDGGAMAVGTQFTVSGVGTHSISYYSNDVAGNSEDVKFASIKIDNCPVAYNPDQIDTDSDLKGDVCDPCPGDPTDTCDPSATEAAVIGSSGGNVTTENGAMTAVIPEGAVTSDTTITLIAGASNFGVGSNMGIGNMLLHYDILPLGATFSQPVTLVFHYAQGTMPEAGKKERSIDVFYNDPAEGWVALGAALDMAANTLTIQVTHFSEYAVMEGADTDNDGIFDNWMGETDTCIYNSGPAEWQGCPYADLSIVEMHIIDLTKTKCPGGAGACKSSIGGASVKVFDRNDASFQARWTKNPSGVQYPDVYEADVGRIASCATAADGTCIAGEATAGDYLVIVKYADAETGKAVYSGKPKSATDFVNSLATKDFQVIKVYSKTGAVSFKAGDKTQIIGSLLEIIYPQYTIWESYEELYPFIFTSDSDWNVDVCMQIPTGYQIKYIMDDAGNLLPATQCAQAFVSDETKVVMFGIVDVGSPDPNMKIKLNAKDPKGKKHAVELDTPGITKARERAEKAKGLPFIGTLLGEDPVSAVGVLIALVAVIAAAVYIIGKQPAKKEKRGKKAGHN